MSNPLIPPFPIYDPVKMREAIRRTVEHQNKVIENARRTIRRINRQQKSKHPVSHYRRRAHKARPKPVSWRIK